MLKSLLISGAVITGAAVVACVAYLGKKAVNTLEEVVDTIEEEELEVAEVTKEIIKDVVTKGNGEILYKYAPNTADELLDAIINVVGILNTFIRVSYTLSGLLYGYRFTKLMYFMYLKPRFVTV